MNANELADKLETEDCCTLDMEAVADMIRQQQAEISNLKAGLLSHHDIYPVKEQITDEEILEELFIPKSEWNSYKAHHCLKQIRAILRKAQEK